MFKLQSEQSLVQSFRPRDRKTLELPPGLTYPLFVRDYLSWVDPSGAHVYLVFNLGQGAPTGIAFRRAGGADPSISILCDWCHTSGTGDRVGLLTTAVDSRKRVGVHACLDLSCKAKLEESADRSGKNPVDLVKQLVERMGRFASQGLRIDLSGAGRD
jgi:hypothetical protein